MGGDVGKVVKTAVIAAAVATGVGLVLTPTLVAGATFAGMSGTLAYFAGSFAVNAALGAVGSALASKPEANTSVAELQGRTVMTKQSIVSRKIVYGEKNIGRDRVPGDNQRQRRSSRLRHFGGA